MGKQMVDRIRDAYSLGLKAGQDTAYQRAYDYLSIAMRDAGLSGAKIKAICRAAVELDGELGRAWEPMRDPEADVCQDRLDRRLKEIFGNDFVPFEKRYPYIKRVKY